MIDSKNHRFIVTSVSIAQERAIAPWAAEGFVAGPVSRSMDISLIFHNEKAVADFARIPEFTEMLGREMDRLGLCRYCGCQLHNDEKPNCTQCGGPRIDKA